MKGTFISFVLRLNHATRDWHSRVVTLSETKGLSERFFATLRMTRPRGARVKCMRVTADEKLDSRC
jgi:hypothetical protein